MWRNLRCFRTHRRIQLLLGVGQRACCWPGRSRNGLDCAQVACELRWVSPATRISRCTCARGRSYDELAASDYGMLPAALSAHCAIKCICITALEHAHSHPHRVRSIMSLKRASSRILIVHLFCQVCFAHRTRSTGSFATCGRIVGSKLASPETDAQTRRNSAALTGGHDTYDGCNIVRLSAIASLRL